MKNATKKEWDKEIAMNKRAKKIVQKVFSRRLKLFRIITGTSDAQNVIKGK
jgi:hypothetical protein